MKIIIDTDPGTDDALTLAFGAIFFKQNVKAIISSYGNVCGETTYNNLQKLAKLLKYDCPIYKGNRLPNSHNHITFTDFHGSDGLCGVDLPNIKNNQPKPEYDDLESLYKLIKKQNKVKYISIAPLTNFSILLKRFPDIVNYIDELVVMGGGLNTFNAEHNCEYNFSLDPIAVKEVFSSSVNITLCPLDMTHKLALSINEIKNITTTKKYNLITSFSSFNILKQILYKNYETAILHNQEGAIIHDITTLIYLFYPQRCEFVFKKIASNDYGAIFESVDGKLVKVIKTISKSDIKHSLKSMFNILERN